jgi:cobalt-zinc-cadmium efflux system outer membrane protein
VAEAQALSASTAAQAEWRAAVAQLRQAVGDPSVQFERVDADIGRLPSAGLWAPLARRLDTSPAIARAQQEIVRKQALSDLERARRTPDLTVSLGAKRDQQLGRDQAIVGVSLVLPLFDRNQGAILEASRLEDKARAELEAVRASVGAQASQALSQLTSALVQAQTLREKVLPAARQAFAASTKGYELGKFGFLDVLDAQRTLFEAETQALNAAAQAYQADARLLELLGEPAQTKD